MRLRFCLLDADYIEEAGKPLVRLWGVDEDGKPACVLTDSEPYFYILPKDSAKKAEEQIKKELQKKKQNILRIETVKRKLGRDERTFLKIFCILPTDVPKVRELVKTLSEVEEQYEYSINFYRRFLIDNQFSGLQWLIIDGKETKTDYAVAGTIKAVNISSSDIDNSLKLKILAFDTETFEEAGKSRLTMISLASDSLNKVLTYRKTSYKNAEILSDEKQMLERFVEIVREQNPDIILSYNGDAFDFALMQERALELKTKLALGRDGSNIKFERRARTSSARIAGRVHVDLYGFISNVLGTQLQTETLSLDAVSAELLSDRKIEMEFEQIMEDWREKKDLAKLAEYCLKNSQLALRLGDYILPQVFELSKLVGQMPFDVSRMMYSQLVEWFLSKRAFALRTIIPNQPKFAEIESRRLKPRYIGGYVKEPMGGIHEGIAVLDFRSLYPSIIATFNISPETMDCEKKEKGHQVPESKHWFCKDEGFVSKVIRELIERRIELKKKLKTINDKKELRRMKNEELSLKTVTNACYGYLAFSGSKWYCYECAESAAAFGRFFIKKIIAEAEKEGFAVIYADTDSCFVKLKKSSQKYAK
ncbi:MAG: DNA-directed DNA polymerase [Candidatus Aenigmatarchaeota archaeon]